MRKVTALLRPSQTQTSGQRDSNTQCLKTKSALQQFLGPRPDSSRCFRSMCFIAQNALSSLTFTLGQHILYEKINSL